ncbi:hypothetical protein BJ138DRAFT_1186766, partial [Hygrophoropsis aurantiaca]
QTSFPDEGNLEVRKSGLELNGTRSEHWISSGKVFGDPEFVGTCMGYDRMTTHWIHVDEQTAKWTLHAQVIAFRGFSGEHSGTNIGRYFVGLCQRAVITRIAAIENNTAIWEYDPTLPNNRVLGNSLDVVAAVRTLAIKLKCAIEVPLTIPLHSNIRSGTADGMLSRSYQLHQPINLFISSTDELFGPITTIRRHGRVVKHIPWTAFTFLPSDWQHIYDTWVIILVTHPGFQNLSLA